MASSRTIACLQHSCDAADRGQELTLLVDLELRNNRSKIEEEERFDLSKEGTFNNTNVLQCFSKLSTWSVITVICRLLTNICMEADHGRVRRDHFVKLALCGICNLFFIGNIKGRMKTITCNSYNINITVTDHHKLQVE